LLEDGGLMMGYNSPRRLCALAEGFIEGAADHFHETAQAEHVECMHRGDPKCLVKMAFRQAA
jgi:predicted hydrocarbon binding protein